MAKILIVEDDPYVRRFYERLYRVAEVDHQIEMAADGEEGLAKAKTFKPTLILLDIMMPKMDGFEVLERLKADPETADIVVVMLTALGDEESAKRATSLGAAGFIVKSEVPYEELLRTVDKYTKSESST